LLEYIFFCVLLSEEQKIRKMRYVEDDMKKMNLFLTTAAMVGMLSLTGCGVTVSTGNPMVPIKEVATEKISEETEVTTYTTPVDAAETEQEVADEFAAGTMQVMEEELAEETVETAETENVFVQPEYTDWSQSLDQDKEWMYIFSENEELAYCFELTTDETDYLTYGTLICQGNNGTYWEYKTGKHELGQNYTIELIYEAEKTFYVNDGGTIVALDARDGHVIWKNADYQGGGSTAIMDDDGNLYVAGYEFPALTIIDPNGNTKLFAEQFADYYWTRDMVIEDNILSIYYEGREGAKVQMDLKDYSYNIM
jgi:hypothetical protein